MMQLWAQVVGGAIGVSMLGAIAGTLGWGASLLMRFGLRGSWPRHAPTETELAQAFAHPG
jgi:hypothetical protein